MSVKDAWNNSTMVRKAFLILLIILLALSVAGLVVKTVDQLKSSNKSRVTVEEGVGETAQVTINKETFSPQTIEIKKGTTVVWINDDTAAHHIASDPHPSHDGLAGFDSEAPVAPGESFQFTFDVPGNYTYHDHLNPLVLKGTVVVLE